jgi:hypothetical protein
LNAASDFAIDELGLPVRNVLKGMPPSAFYCPGSILEINFEADEPLADGIPLATRESKKAGIAWFENGPAFEPVGSGARVVARFAEANDVLLSGWLLGANKIAGKAAIVEAKRGQGRIILFAFRPQYRGQSTATLPWLINAISTSQLPEPK